MAEIATIARPYAEALFKAATSVVGINLDEVVAWVDELGQIAGTPELLQLVENPKVTQDQVFDLMKGLVPSAQSELAQNFLSTVIGNGRVNVLPEVAAQFRALVNRRKGSSDAKVVSAFPIDEAALAELGAVLEKRFGRKLNLSVQIDSSLIGGIRVVVGDEVLDTSVQARLEQMKAALTA